MKFLVIANFKSHKTKAEISAWQKQVANSLLTTDQLEAVYCPPMPYLSLDPESSSLALGAQDVSPYPAGSYTGAVNADQLKEFGVKYAIVGHSERRRYFHETAQDVASKVRELLSVGITPLVCMERDQIAPQFGALDDEDVDKCVFCFEPSADIGGTTIAPLTLIQEVFSEIRGFAPNSSVVYGGSVTPNNITDLLPLKLGGVLVATASLEADSFLAIVEKVNHAS